MKILHTKQTNEHRTNEIMAFFQQQQQQKTRSSFHHSNSDASDRNHPQYKYTFEQRRAITHQVRNMSENGYIFGVQKFG